MSESTLTPETPEQANERQAKQQLVDALADLRKHANSARNKAQELIYTLEEVIKAIPAGVTPDALDLDAIGVALAVALATGIDASDANGLKREIERLEDELYHANDEHRYLVAGDFSFEEI